MRNRDSRMLPQLKSIGIELFGRRCAVYIALLWLIWSCSTYDLSPFVYFVVCPRKEVLF